VLPRSENEAFSGEKWGFKHDKAFSMAYVSQDNLSLFMSVKCQKNVISSAWFPLYNTAKAMERYVIDRLVNVTVERVLPFGVFVRLPDGSQGYIRRRELDLDADVDPSLVVRAGDVIAAKVIAPGSAGKNLELSRRATLPNPWPEFARRVKKGEVVRGAVHAVRPEGVFVRVEAGIDGFVPLEELATWQVSKPEELLWAGDEVEAIVTQLDARNERLTLSIKARMEQRAQATRIVEQLTAQAAERAPTASQKELPPITAEEREQVGQVIVIDDDDRICKGLVERLKQRGYNAGAAQTLDEIQARIRSSERIVLLFDIHLSGGDGLDWMRRLNVNGDNTVVCVMSSPEWLMERSEEIRAAKVWQAFEKPLHVDEIDRFLHRLARGEAQPVWRALPRRKKEKTEPQALNIALRDVAPSRRLQAALEKIIEMAHAEKGIVFVKDPTSQTFSIAAEAGALPFYQEALYDLKDSPVKDVMVENQPVFEGRATAHKRFAKLLGLLDFESCIGAPIETMGEVRHALFLFHRQPDAFARVRPQYVELDVLWLRTLLEEQAVQARLRAISPLLLSGELALGLAHEVYNKTDGLELQLSNLLSPTHSSTDLQTRLTDLYNSVIDLKTLAGSFQQLMAAKETPTTFDVNEVVRRAAMLIHPLAGKESVKIDLRLTEDLPQVTGNSIALQQVFFNIMLNAVQQTARKPDKHRLLEISTSYQPDHTRPLLIRFTDTGPGIHKQLWEKIFELGFSNRGGSGLGLFIARSFIEMFEGEIKVEESVVPLGATFLVELPVYEK
jgi:signal transduction histidine kinase/predicted RNA-binding protein with RPS1 domain/DNA-binding response OmpR family regulator